MPVTPDMIIGAIKGAMEIGGKTWDFMIGERGAVNAAEAEINPFTEEAKTKAKAAAEEVAKAATEEGEDEPHVHIAFNVGQTVKKKYNFTRHARTIVGPLATVYVLPLEVWVEYGTLEVGVDGMGQGNAKYIHSIWVGKAAGNVKGQMIASGAVNVDISPNSSDNISTDYTITIACQLKTRGKTTFDPDDSTDKITVSPSSADFALEGTHLTPA